MERRTLTFRWALTLVFLMVVESIVLTYYYTHTRPKTEHVDIGQPLHGTYPDVVFKTPTVDSTFHVCVEYFYMDDYVIHWTQDGWVHKEGIMNSFTLGTLHPAEQEMLFHSRAAALGYAKTLTSAKQCRKIDSISHVNYLAYCRQWEIDDSIRKAPTCIK